MANFSLDPTLTAIQQRVLLKLPKGPSRENFVGAVRAISYRWLAVGDYAESYVSTLSQLDSWDNRYAQEKALLGFFVSGLAALESFYFGVYFVGEYLRPPSFSLAANPRKITPSATAKAYQNAFALVQPPEPFLTALQGTLDDQQFDQWSDQRNFLAHRVSPSRVVQLESVVPVRAKGGSRISRTDIWNAAAPLNLDENLTDSRLLWLKNSLERLIQAADQFTKQNL